MLATDALLLLQVPPVEMSLKVVDAPEQIAVTPDIAGVAAFTVTIVEVEQPREVNVITDVATLLLPETTPVTTPEEFTVAVPVLLLLHVPPVVVSPKAVVAPWHTFVMPVIDAGTGLTVTMVVRVQPDEDV